MTLCCPMHYWCLPPNLTKHILSTSGPDNDLRPHGSDADLHTRVAILSQLPSQELVELGIENSVSDELHL